jgi:hypothetical protein
MECGGKQRSREDTKTVYQIVVREELSRRFAQP